MKKYISLLWAALLLMVSCKTTVPERSFSIGKGGGFTGKYDEYLVKSTGEVLNISNKQTPTHFIQLGKDQIKAIFQGLEKLNIAKMNFSHPGNITSYIRCDINNKTYEIKWGDTKNVPPQMVQDFFNSTWSLIRPK